MSLNTTVHPNDFLFGFIKERTGMSDADVLAHYLENGRTSAEKLNEIIVHDLKMNQPFQMLDFASGYGMVARHYSSVLSQAQVITCDIHAEANAFNQTQFGFETIQSKSVPEELIMDRQFDAVFTLSFFSHISDAYFSRWLLRLYQLVKPGGYLIFTTHGRVTSGYALANGQIIFHPDSEQKDLEGQFYGTAYTHPSYVMSQISDLQAHHPLKIALFKEAHWWEHQDLYVVQKKL